MEARRSCAEVSGSQATSGAKGHGFPAVDDNLNRGNFCLRGIGGQLIW